MMLRIKEPERVFGDQPVFMTTTSAKERIIPFFFPTHSTRACFGGTTIEGP